LFFGDFGCFLVWGYFVLVLLEWGVFVLMLGWGDFFYDMVGVD